MCITSMLFIQVKEAFFFKRKFRRPFILILAGVTDSAQFTKILFMLPVREKYIITLLILILISF